MSDRVHTEEMKAPRAEPAWGDIGATLARLGVPLNFAPAVAVDVHEPELPLEGGGGIAPIDLESKRHVAALVRGLYDDVYDYALDVEGPQEPTEDVTETPPQVIDDAPPAPFAVEAFDRKTGKPIKVRVKMLPHAAAKPDASPTG